MQIFDISRALTNGLAPWPGDTPFHFELKWKMAEGATVNVGAVEMGVHNGTQPTHRFISRRARRRSIGCRSKLTWAMPWWST